MVNSNNRVESAKECDKPTFHYLSNCHPEESTAAKVSRVFQKGFAGASPAQPFWNIENLENSSQIVPKRRRTSESYAIENKSRDQDSASVPKGVASETAQSTDNNSMRMHRRHQ